MAKVNKTKYAILGVLSLQSGSGYDIKKFCDSSIGFFWNENYGHIYPMLQKMEQEGLIKEIEQTIERTAKKIYSITEKGKEELEKWLIEPVDYAPVRSEFLLKMFLSKDIPIENVIKKIKKLKEDCERDLEIDINIYSDLEKHFVSSPEVSKKAASLWLSVVKFGERNEQSKIKWCKETIELLESVED